MTFRERLMIVCTGLLFAACAIVLVRYGTYQFLIRDFHQDNAWTTTIFADQPSLQQYQPTRSTPPEEVPVDWAAQYPFPETPVAPHPQHEGFIQQEGQAFHEQAGKFETWSNQKFFSYMKFIEAMRIYQRAIRWNIPLYSDLYSFTELPDGRLTGFLRKIDVSRPASQIAEFSTFCKENGIHCLFVLAPNKIAHGDPYDGTLDFSNENADMLLSQLKKNGIDCFDLRPVLDAQVEKRSDLFFQTDHHWKPQTARSAAQAIAHELNIRYGYTANLSLLEPSQYTEKIYPSHHLGSYGQRLTLAIAQPDDFTLYYPDFPTSFRLQIPSMAIDHTGDFSIFYYMKELDLPYGFYGAHAYGAYAYGERALLSIQNERSSDSRKLLLVRDSFSDAMIPFLALGMEHLDAIDVRRFTGSLQAYLKKEHPDTVVICYTVSELNWNQSNPRDVFSLR